MDGNDELSEGSETIQAMARKKNQWSMKWSSTEYAQKVRTTEACSEAIPTMPSNDESVREVKEYKPYPKRMNQWGKLSNVNHAH